MADGATLGHRRPRSPRGQGKQLRVELLDAAAELMAKHGSLDKVSVRAVAHAVGVSPTAVYRHFDNHTEMLWAS
ncbi:MAG: helix-turn-helix domain-containing protein, partial [Acidimicrobiales bacterium]